MVSSTPRPHFTPGKDPVPILQEAGWAPGPVCTGGKSRHHRDSISDRPARSQSLYRQIYPAHIYIYMYVCIKGTFFIVMSDNLITPLTCFLSLYLQRNSGCLSIQHSRDLLLDMHAVCFNVQGFVCVADKGSSLP